MIKGWLSFITEVINQISDYYAILYSKEGPKYGKPIIYCSVQCELVRNNV